ncbi:unnamed protein product [Lupinus luteus]|uniref:Uncharacterized protein n=1 Tax=Lupinus luteus TaxID=3873 RepID=A0AAV1XM45_LUPLU
MGLPQIPQSETAENVAAVGAVLDCSQQFSDRSPSCVDSSMNNVNSDGLAAYTLRSSLDDDFSKKTLSFDRSPLFASKSGQSVYIPASRVVGFESCQTSSFNDGSAEVSDANLHSFAFTYVAANDTEATGSLVRLPMIMAPLSTMLSPSHFKGYPEDNGSKNIEISSLVKNDNVGNTIEQDNKKANIGSKNNHTMPT